MASDTFNKRRAHRVRCLVLMTSNSHCRCCASTFAPPLTKEGTFGCRRIAAVVFCFCEKVAKCPGALPPAVVTYVQQWGCCRHQHSTNSSNSKVFCGCSTCSACWRRNERPLSKILRFPRHPCMSIKYCCGIPRKPLLKCSALHLPSCFLDA